MIAREEGRWAILFAMILCGVARSSWYNTIVKERGEAEPFFNGRN